MRLKRNCALSRDFKELSSGGHIFTDAFHAKMEELDRADPCTRNQLFCLVRTGANFAILVEMTKFKFSKKNKESKLILRTDPFRRMY